MKTMDKTNETKSFLFEQINKIEKALARIFKNKRERVQTNKIRNEKEVITDITEIQRIIRGYYKKLHANKMDTNKEMDRFLQRYILQRLNQEEIENINIPITITKIETVI